MQNININITPGDYPQTLYFSQGDIGREFKINVTDYEIPNGATVKIQATKPSGFGFSVAAGTISENTVTFVTTAVMTDEAGRFQAELQITDGSNVLGTANFLMAVELNPHPEGTTDGSQGTIIPELTLLVERVEAAASSVLDMEVVAETLPAGSQASYSYDENLNKATFGIPEGQAGAGAAGVVASAYSAAKTYKVGDYVLYNSNLYRCSTAITTAEAWNAAHWTQIVLADDVADLKTDLSENYYNKFDKSTIEKGKTVLSDGTISSGSGYNLSDYIPTNGLTTIYTEWSGNYFQFRVAVYNSNKVFQERKTSGVLSAGKGVFTLTNEGYIRVILQSASNSDGQNDLDTVLVVDGEDLKPYVPNIIAVDYKERQATEHIKNIEFFTNLLDESDTANVRTGGFFGSSGWTSNANFNTYFVPIEPCKTYYTNTPSQAVGVCDENKNFISYVPVRADGTFYTSILNAKYAGVAFKADLSNRGKQMFVNGESLPTWYLNPNVPTIYDYNSKAFVEDTRWRGKSWYSFGTSMEDIGIGGASGNVGTSGKWPLYVDGVSGLIRNNQAVGGGGICPSTSGQGLVKTRVLACPYDVDLVTIEAGPNDWTEITLGEVGDIGDDTFLGNLRQCYEYLTENTRARVVSICISNSNDNGGKPFYKNSFGYTYRDYMNGVRELSKYYGITNIDVAGDLLGYGRRTADLIKDHIHYTELGGSVVGEFIWNKLKLVEPFPRFIKEEANL